MRGLRQINSGLAVVLALAGCATVPPADISGRWSGSWAGYGLLNIPREEAAKAELVQAGEEGHGRIVLDGTTAAGSVPMVLRHSGAAGARVVVSVKGSRVVMVHELGRDLFAADFTVEGDRMVGRIRDAEPAIRITLFRVTDEAPMPALPTSDSSAPDASRPASTTPELGGDAAAAPEPAAAPALATAGPGEATEGPVDRSGAVPASQDAANPGEGAPERLSPEGFLAIPQLVSIHFDFDRFELRPQEADQLEANARWLREHEGLAVLIEGHTDARGTGEYNLALSERRARATRDFLLARGIAARRMATTFYGEEHPRCHEPTEECWRENRRADFLVRPAETLGDSSAR